MHLIIAKNDKVKLVKRVLLDEYLPHNSFNNFLKFSYWTKLSFLYIKLAMKLTYVRELAYNDDYVQKYDRGKRAENENVQFR